MRYAYCSVCKVVEKVSNSTIQVLHSHERNGICERFSLLILNRAGYERLIKDHSIKARSLDIDIDELELKLKEYRDKRDSYRLIESEDE